MTYRDFPLLECMHAAETLIASGATVYQKWTCAKCGERVTANNPNTFTARATHDDCGGAETDIVQSGCNYVVIMAVHP
jgi:hypothetical protein